MSAVTVETEIPVEAPVPAPVQLSVVERPHQSVSALGFGLMIVALVVAGLALVMVITTSVAQQSREIARLTTQSTELGYRHAALATELQQKESANSLALRATQLGMVPNPYPVFISLEDGTVLGEPTPVTGDELSFLWETASEESSPDGGAAAEPGEEG